MDEIQAGCPSCGSDDYTVVEYYNGLPDYTGPKICENCGEEWQ